MPIVEKSRRAIPRTYSLLLLLLLLPLGLASCQFEAKQRPVLAFDRSNPTANGSRYPVLASDDPDRVVMAWISSIEERVSTIEIAERIETQWYAPEPIHVGEEIGRTPMDRPQLALSSDGSRWIAWREWRRGGRLVISRQSDASSRWVHHRIPLSADEGSQSVPRMDILDNQPVILWYETTSQGTTIRAARWDSAMEGGELRLDNGEGPGGWRPVGSPIPVDGDLSGEPVMSIRNGQLLLAWLEAGPDGARLESTEFPLREMESPPTITTVGEWGPVGEPSEQTAFLSMGYGESGEVALTVSLEGPEQRTSRLYLNGAGSWTDRTPDSWGEQTGRTVIQPDPEGGWIIVWQERAEPLSSLWLQRLASDGTPLPDEPLGKPIRVGSVDSHLTSGVAELLPLSEEGIFLSWTQTDPFLRVRTALVPRDYDPGR